MTKKAKRPPGEDEAQSRRFMEAAAEAEASGGLSPIEAEVEFERAIDRVMPSRRPTTD